jgi:hypothetical protein
VIEPNSEIDARWFSWSDDPPPENGSSNGGLRTMPQSAANTSLPSPDA